jgi:hypothetical protein
MRWMAALRAHPGLTIAVVAALVPVWSWLFAAPRVTASVARQAGCVPVTRATWARATLLSMAVVAGVAALGTLATATAGSTALPVTPVFAMIATAVVLDLLAGARAHRRPLATAGVLHQIQLADLVEQALAEAGIPCHIEASNLRTLFAFFGPWAPAIVRVPEAHAEDARARLGELLWPLTARQGEPRGDVPRAVMNRS